MTCHLSIWGLQALRTYFGFGDDLLFCFILLKHVCAALKGLSWKEIVQCVVDEAHLLCYKDSVGSEKDGQKRLKLELEKKHFKVVSEQVIAVRILGELPDKTSILRKRTDLLVNNMVVVEVKLDSRVKDGLRDGDRAQLRSYMTHPKLNKDYGVLLSWPKNCSPATLHAEVAIKGDGFKPGTKFIHFEPIEALDEALQQRHKLRNNH